MAADWVASTLTGQIHHNISTAFQLLPVPESSRCWWTAAYLDQGKGQSALQTSSGEGERQWQGRELSGEVENLPKIFLSPVPTASSPFTWQLYLLRRGFLSLKPLNKSQIICSARGYLKSWFTHNITFKYALLGSIYSYFWKSKPTLRWIQIHDFT